MRRSFANGCCALRGLNGEVPDLVQECCWSWSASFLPSSAQREGSFRCWLRTIATNQLRECWKRKKRQPGLIDEAYDFLAQLENTASELSRQWDREHDRFVLEKLFKTVQADFSPATWQAFRRFAVDGLPAKNVASELGINENAVLLAKVRVLKRLRQESAGLLD